MKNFPVFICIILLVFTCVSCDELLLQDDPTDTENPANNTPQCPQDPQDPQNPQDPVYTPDPPTVNAGENQIKYKPSNVASLSAELSGTAHSVYSTITGYFWDLYMSDLTDGAPQPTIIQPNAASTMVFGLQVGYYVFRLTVLDNYGQSSFAFIYIVVIPQ